MRDLFLAGRFGRLPVSISRKKHRPESLRSQFRQGHDMLYGHRQVEIWNKHSGHPMPRREQKKNNEWTGTRY
jgi:hypothetical protein